METFCDECQQVPVKRYFKEKPALCPLCARERVRKTHREWARMIRQNRRTLPKLSKITQSGMAVTGWADIAYILGSNDRFAGDARTCLRQALQRIQKSGCDVALLFDHLYSHQLFHKTRISLALAARMQIEIWQMKADIMEPEAPLEARAIRQEVAELKKVMAFKGAAR